MVNSSDLKKESFIALLENQHKIQQLETAELKIIVDEHPYFQAARALYLKGLKNQDFPPSADLFFKFTVDSVKPPPGGLRP